MKDAGKLAVRQRGEESTMPKRQVQTHNAHNTNECVLNACCLTRRRGCMVGDAKRWRRGEASNEAFQIDGPSASREAQTKPLTGN